MPIRKIYLLCVIVCLTSSCEKKRKDVLFHGKVHLCNGTPVSNILIDIDRIYYDNGENKSSIGTATTDVNGEYSLTMDVDLPGKSGSYNLSVVDTNYLVYTFNESDNKDSETDIEKNFTLYSGCISKCHIKNVSPINNDDEFVSLIYRSGSDYNDLTTAIQNLSGMTVDTTIVLNIHLNSVYLKYTFTKNGVTTVGNDTIARPVCNDTVGVDIFY